MTIGYPGDYDPDPEFLPYWTGYPAPPPPPPPNPSPAYSGPMQDSHRPVDAPLRHTAASERALHAFDQIAEAMLGRTGLHLVLEDIRTQLSRLSPYGEWRDSEKEALERARLSVVNAIDLLSRLEQS